MSNTRKIMKPETFNSFKKLLSENCRFMVDSSDGLFSVRHISGNVEIEDIASAPDTHCETFSNVEEFISSFKIEDCILKDIWEKVSFITH